jgi:hypothetical protein
MLHNAAILSIPCSSRRQHQPSIYLRLPAPASQESPSHETPGSGASSLGVPSLSPPPSPSSTPSPYPPALHPTPLQLSIPHLPYIDLLPFPAVRNNLLLADSLVSCPEIWADFTSGDIRVWGSTPWEPTGWEIGERFARKWWWILDRGVVEKGNFWRGVRGEGGLVVKALN